MERHRVVQTKLEQVDSVEMGSAGDASLWLDTLAHIDHQTAHGGNSAAAAWGHPEPAELQHLSHGASSTATTRSSDSDADLDEAWHVDPVDSWSSTVSGSSSSDTDSSDSPSNDEMDILDHAYMADLFPEPGAPVAQTAAAPHVSAVQSPMWDAGAAPVGQQRANRRRSPAPLLPRVSAAAAPPPPLPQAPPTRPELSVPSVRRPSPIDSSLAVRPAPLPGDAPLVCPLCERECAAQHRMGHFWKSFGYAGPAYCNRCSSVFRAHMLMEGVSEKKCSRQVPCYICKQVLRQFSCPIEDALKSMEAAQKKEKSRKRPAPKPQSAPAARAPAAKHEPACAGSCAVCKKSSDTLGVFWKKFGYEGPPYCTLCSHAFRNHIIRQRKTRVKCSRETPCAQCACILDQCRQDRDSVYQAIDKAQQSLRISAKKRARQLSPTGLSTKAKKYTTAVPAAVLFVTVVACVGLVRHLSPSQIGPAPQADDEPPRPAAAAAAVQCGWEPAHYEYDQVDIEISERDTGRDLDKGTPDDDKATPHASFEHHTIEIDRHVVNTSVQRCADQGPVPVGSLCNYTCDTDDWEPYGNMTCQPKHGDSGGYGYTGGRCRRTMQSINTLYYLSSAPHPFGHNQLLFDQAWSEEFHFVGNQSCGGRWATGQCFCAQASTTSGHADWWDPGAPVVLQMPGAIEDIGGIDYDTVAHPLGSCQDVGICEERQFQLLKSWKEGVCYACAPWRDPASLSLLRRDLLQLNLGALLNIFTATGLPASELPPQLLDNICGSDMPPLNIPGFNPILPREIGKPSFQQTEANPLPKCPETGWLVPNANLSDPVWNHSLANARQQGREETVKQAVQMLGLDVIIPIILCATAQQLLDADGYYRAGFEPVPLPSTVWLHGSEEGGQPPYALKC